MNKTLAFLITLMSAAGGARAQWAPGVEWEICIPNATVNGTLKTSDSTFTVMFDFRSCTDSSAIGLRSYDVNGNLIWEQIYLPPDSGSLHSFSIASNGSTEYLITGCLQKPGSNYNWLLITDSLGNMLAQKALLFDSVASPGNSKLIPDHDGGYFFAGESYSSNFRDLAIIQLTSSCEVIFQSNMGGSEDEYFGDMIPTVSGYLLAAYTSSNDGDVSGNHGNKDIWLLKLGESGYIEWATCYGDTMNEEVHALLELNNGYVMGGISRSNAGMVSGHYGSVDYYDYWVFAIDTMGNLNWSKSLGGSGDDFLTGMTIHEDSAIIISGTSYSENGDIIASNSGSAFSDQWTVKLDAEGNMLWQKSTGGSADDWSCALASLSENELIVTGGTLSSDGDHAQTCFTNSCYVINGGWMVKLNEQCPSFPTAAFSISQSGKEITATNESTKAQSYLWDFGDGSTGNEENPIHTYVLHGVYEICLTAIDSCSVKKTCLSVSTCTETITAAFTVTNEGGTMVSFHDESMDAAQWFWDFGDGNSSVLPSPLHEYGVNGFYEVMLTVSDSCGNISTSSTTVNTCNGFHAGFSTTATAASVAFEDSTLGFPESWLWTFGDGEQSTEQNPLHEFAAAGSYEVCLIASSSVCGADTFCKIITVTCPLLEAAYSFESDFNLVQFSDNTVNTSSWLWTFGDGTVSSEQNPVHLYPAAGNYEACLAVNDGCSADTFCQNIDVSCQQFTAAFEFEQAADTVQFFDLSAGAVEWYWDFGDGQIASDTNPLHIFEDTGTYVVCLISYDGCSMDTVCDSIDIYALSNPSLASFEETCILIPNPASQQTLLRISLQAPATVSAILFDDTGRPLLSIPEQWLLAGKHVFPVSLKEIPAGIYLFEVISSARQQILKLIVD